ncbi:uncharacterized protein LOC134235912, partial [Saccostrea cucullata]|uniref:uncharacterized protein LOC134235912 n=1 Tax=Saccostrea cuccullata TaxID=36930 RepID=UPI002ED24A6E
MKNNKKELNLGKRESGCECDINDKYTDSVHEFSCSAPLLPTNTTGDGEEDRIPETGKLEEGKHVFTKTSVPKKVFETIETDIRSKQEEKTNDVTDAGVNSKPEEKIHDATESGVNSKPWNITHGDTKTGDNSKLEETVSGLQTIEIINEPEEREHDDINTNSEKRSHGNAETSVKPEGKTYKGKEAAVLLSKNLNTYGNSIVQPTLYCMESSPIDGQSCGECIVGTRN